MSSPSAPPIPVRAGRSGSEIVKVAFQLYRRAPVTLMVPTALLYVPMVLYDGWAARQEPSDAAVSGMLDQAMAGTANIDSATANLHQALILSVVGWGIWLLVASMIDAALTPVGAALYVGREASAADGLLALGRRLVSVLVITVFKYAMIGLALLAFVLPAVYVEAVLFAPIQVAMVEGVGVWTSLERSNALSDSVKNHVLVTLTWAGLIYGAVYVVVDILTLFSSSPVVNAVLPTVVFIVVYPFVALCQVVLYYDARERHSAPDDHSLGARTPIVTARVVSG